MPDAGPTPDVPNADEIIVIKTSAKCHDIRPNPTGNRFSRKWWDVCCAIQGSSSILFLFLVLAGGVLSSGWLRLR
jgi:hypothetical protein